MKDRRQEYLIGVRECRCKLVEQAACARILVRFEHTDDSPLRISVPRRSNRRRDCCRMVSIIIDDSYARVSPKIFEPAAEPRKRCKRRFNLVSFDTEFCGDSDGCQGVVNLVTTEKWQFDIAVVMSSVVHPEKQTRLDRAQVFDTPAYES